MMHRIRFAMMTDAPSPKLKGTVEADETFIGGKGDLKTMRIAEKKTAGVMFFCGDQSHQPKGK